MDRQYGQVSGRGSPLEACRKVSYGKVPIDLDRMAIATKDRVLGGFLGKARVIKKRKNYNLTPETS